MGSISLRPVIAKEPGFFLSRINFNLETWVQSGNMGRGRATSEHNSQGNSTLVALAVRFKELCHFATIHAFVKRAIPGEYNFKGLQIASRQYCGRRSSACSNDEKDLLLLVARARG